MSIFRIIVLIPLILLSAWDLPPGFNKTDDQLRHSIDQRWQPTHRITLRPEDKERIFKTYKAFVERIDAQARQPYIIRRSRTLSGSTLSGTIIQPGTTSASGNISPSGQFASAPSGLPGPTQGGTIILSNDTQLTVGSTNTPLTGSQNRIQTGGTGGSDMTEMVWYEYRQRTVVCDVLSQLATIIDTHGFALRRNIIGVTNPIMKHRLMIHREILEYLRQINDNTLTKFYGGTKSSIVINNHPITQWTCSY